MRNTFWFLAIVIPFILGLILFLLWMPTFSSDFYNNGKLICFERKESGLLKEVKKSCYRLTPVEDISRKIDITNYINGELDLRK